MTTLAEMATSIANDTLRSGSADTTAIAEKIQDAIRYYSGRRWWWNEDQGASFNTADGTEYYAIPSPLRVVDSVLVTTSSYPTYMVKRPNQWIEERYTPTSIYKGQPYVYALFEDQIRLYPIPDDVYAVKTQGYGIALPVSTSDNATPWANEAYGLIKNRARALFERDWVMDIEGYQLFTAAERDAFTSLNSENNRRVGTGRVRGWGVGMSPLRR